MEEKPARLIGSAEVARRLDYHPTYLWQLLKDGKLPFNRIMIGGRAKFDESEVDAYIAEQRAKAVS